MKSPIVRNGGGHSRSPLARPCCLSVQWRRKHSCCPNIQQGSKSVTRESSYYEHFQRPFIRIQCDIASRVSFPYHPSVEIPLAPCTRISAFLVSGPNQPSIVTPRSLLQYFRDACSARTAFLYPLLPFLLGIASYSRQSVVTVRDTLAPPDSRRAGIPRSSKVPFCTVR